MVPRALSGRRVRCRLGMKTPLRLPRARGGVERTKKAAAGCLIWGAFSAGTDDRTTFCGRLADFRRCVTPTDNPESRRPTFVEIKPTILTVTLP